MKNRQLPAGFVLTKFGLYGMIASALFKFRIKPEEGWVMLSAKEDFNQFYARCHFEFSLLYACLHVDSIVVSALQRFGLAGPVLDVGAGTGSESLILASLGLEVEALDISEVAIQKIEHEARRLGLPLKAKVVDIMETTLSASYHTIICSKVLQYLPPAAGEAFLAQMRSATAPDGVHILRVHGDSEYGRYRASKEEPWVTYSEDQLRAYYRDWDILDLDNYTCMVERDDYRLEHSSLALIARKQ